jgi:pyruvate formate lyase activating enzyme
VCRIRFNRDGELRVPHGYVAGLGVDPIEKKPFFHVLPGQTAMSFGMLGCDLHCPFCQNWLTSQTLRDTDAVVQPSFTDAERIVELALEHETPLLTSTYNEPLITAEWAVAIFKAGKPHGLRGTLVSNGYATPEVLEYLRPHVVAMNIDLKAFRDEAYRRLGGQREHVLDTIRRAHELGFWIEVVTLVVPMINDSDEELKQMAEFIAGVSREIPWHVTAFRPTYKLLEPPSTPAETLLRAVEHGQSAGLNYIYAGNLPGRVQHHEDTRCPKCGATVIRRHGFYLAENRLMDGACPDCRTAIAGLWQ